ncbi:MAG: zf-HC2 domain-containing protein [Gemmatimonadota bacterium]|nr:zf-HC2 domain-containing protein [Gemmatimonadota bacterium]
MTDCPRGEIRDLLPELVHDALDANTRAEAERHVAGCVDCAAEVALLRSMRSALGARTPAVDVARIVAAVQGANVAAPRLVVPSKRGFSMPRHWRAAAAIIAVSAGSLIVLKQRAVSERPAQEMTFDGGVSDLDTQDLRALMGDLKDLDALTSADPAPLMTLPAPVVENR